MSARSSNARAVRATNMFRRLGPIGVDRRQTSTGDLQVQVQVQVQVTQFRGRRAEFRRAPYPAVQTLQSRGGFRASAETRVKKKESTPEDNKKEESPGENLKDENAATGTNIRTECGGSDTTEKVTIKHEEDAQIGNDGVHTKAEKSDKNVPTQTQNISRFGYDGLPIKQEPDDADYVLRQRAATVDDGTNLPLYPTGIEPELDVYHNGEDAPQDVNTANDGGMRADESGSNMGDSDSDEGENNNGLTCDVCENQTTEELSIVLECSHRCCADCLEQAVLSAINDDYYFPAMCGLDAGEINVEHNEQVQQLLSPLLVRRYVRKLVQKRDADQLACAGCGALIGQTQRTQRRAGIRCDACGAWTCNHCKSQWHHNTPCVVVEGV